MPELAAVYALGVLVSLSLAFVMLWSSRRRRQSARLKVLNGNLAKAELFWSDHSDALVERDEQNEELERRALTRSFLVSGLLFSTLSWLGLLFLGVLFFSIHVLARSRLERRLFESRLATEPQLTPEEVRSLIDEVKKI